jgi:hypothetical protein
MRVVLNLALMALAIASVPSTASEIVQVLSHGDSVATAAIGELKVRVKISTHEKQIGSPSDERPAVLPSNCTYSKFPCSLVDSITIAVNGQPLFIPRSVFADLADVYKASITLAGKIGSLRLDGGDGSEGYIAIIEFDASRVRRRSLASGTMPTRPLQETIYHSLGDAE